MLPTKKLINRDTYLNQLISWKNKEEIKVVTGIRRCGKSVLFTLFQNYLSTQGERVTDDKAKAD